MRYRQIKRIADVGELREHLAASGITIPLADEVDPIGPLSTSTSFTDGSAGTFEIPNRFAILPMEGWDGTTDGRPTDLVRRRWERFATSGCGLVWGEATAVRPDGRANPNQLVLDEHTADDIAGLRSLLAPGQVAGLQLTHSGRFARPDGSPAPRTAYAHPLLDERVGADERAVFSDDELEDLAGAYIDAAVLAAGAGFDFVDVKHCHGYLLHEMLSATDRPGPFGGSLDNRLRFLRTVVGGIRDRAPGLAVGVRLSVFDFVPFSPDADGVGTPQADGWYDRAFGGDGSGAGIDLTEPHALLDELSSLGVGLLCTTAGSPYYNPHIQRPAFFPPSDGYQPPEDPLVGVARQVAATAELAAAHPDLCVIGSGYSYLQDWFCHAAQAVVAGGGASMVGLGRMALSYPDLAADTLAGDEIDRRRICRTLSDCTTAPRHGLISGCFPLDPFYKSHPAFVELAAAKRAARR